MQKFIHFSKQKEGDVYWKFRLSLHNESVKKNQKHLSVNTQLHNLRIRTAYSRPTKGEKNVYHSR